MLLDTSDTERPGLLAELACGGRRVPIYRAWLAAALALLSAATIMFLFAMVKADQDTGRRVTWEWVPYLLMLAGYVPLFGVRVGSALDTADRWQDEVETCVRISAAALIATVAACLDMVLLPRQRFGAKEHASANTAVGVLMLLQLFAQYASVFFMWLYTVGHRRHLAAAQL